MTNIECFNQHCDDRKELTKIKQLYKELENKYNQLVDRCELLTKTKLGDTEHSTIIKQNTELITQNRILELQNQKYNIDLRLKTEQIESYKNKLVKMGGEMEDIRDKYELDEEIQKRLKKIQELESQDVKMRFTIQKLQTQEEKLKIQNKQFEEKLEALKNKKKPKNKSSAKNSWIINARNRLRGY